MISFQRKMALRKQAGGTVTARRKTEALARTGQVARSTVRVGDDDVALDAVLVGAVDEAVAGEARDSDIAFLDESDVDSFDTVIDAGDAADVDSMLDAQEGDPDLIDQFDADADADEDAHQADMTAIGANRVVTDALAAAEDASELALEAKITADGRNRIYAQALNPVASPEFPFVNGDLWYRTETVGSVTRFVEVSMWNGTEWKPYQMVASSLLVPGTVGPTLIENGAITTGKLAATAIDGMTVTGALLRTAASGARFELTNIGLIGYNAFGAVTARMTPGSGGISVTSPAGDTATSMTGATMRVAKTATSTDAEVSITRDGVTSKAQAEYAGIGANNGESALLPALTRAQRIVGTGTYPAFGADNASISARSEESALGLLHRAAGSTVSVGVDIRAGGAAGAYFALIEAFESVELEVKSNGGIYLNAPKVRFQGDTDWASVTIPGTAAGGIFRWQTKAGRVWLEFDITYSTAAAAGAFAAANLVVFDPAYRPAGAPIPLRVIADNTPVAGYVNSAGAFRVRNNTAAPVTRFYGGGDWPLP